MIGELQVKRVDFLNMFPGGLGISSFMRQMASYGDRRQTLVDNVSAKIVDRSQVDLL